jgi:hypothetical protein
VGPLAGSLSVSGAQSFDAFALVELAGGDLLQKLECIQVRSRPSARTDANASATTSRRCAERTSASYCSTDMTTTSGLAMRTHERRRTFGDPRYGRGQTGTELPHRKHLGHDQGSSACECVHPFGLASGAANLS